VLLYAGGVFWTLGYDTIYALQDLEDDALAGVKSSARRLGANVPRAVLGFYATATVLEVVAGVLGGLGVLFVPVAALYGTHLWRQAMQVKVGDPRLALALFRLNTWAGLILAVALAVGACHI
jgi:4-hydroxybenzoate polyprenyltransferase